MPFKEHNMKNYSDLIKPYLLHESWYYYNFTSGPSERNQLKDHGNTLYDPAPTHLLKFEAQCLLLILTSCLHRNSIYPKAEWTSISEAEGADCLWRETFKDYILGCSVEPIHMLHIYTT